MWKTHLKGSNVWDKSWSLPVGWSTSCKFLSHSQTLKLDRDVRLGQTLEWSLRIQKPDTWMISSPIIEHSSLLCQSVNNSSKKFYRCGHRLDGRRNLAVIITLGKTRNQPMVPMIQNSFCCLTKKFATNKHSSLLCLNVRSKENIFIYTTVGSVINILRS
jgi:hypothetical protein